MNTETHETISGRIVAIASDGSGILRRDGEKTVFVPGALPGEDVVARITLSKKHYLKAELVEVKAPSRLRTKPDCQHYGHCGGCQLQHVQSAEQPALKQSWFVESCSRLGHWPKESIETLKGNIQVLALDPWRYRRRVRLHFGPKSDGIFALGYAESQSPQSQRNPAQRRGRRDNSPNVLPITHCPILHPLLESCISPLESALREVKFAKRTPLQIELTLIHAPSASGPDGPIVSISAYYEGRDRRPVRSDIERQLGRSLTERGIPLLQPDIRGEIHPLECNPTSRFSDRGEQVSFHVKGFVQPHKDAPQAYAKIVSQIAKYIAMSLSKGAPDFLIWDLFGGAGMFTHALRASLGQSLQATIVEQSPWSVHAAKANFEDPRVQISQTDVESFLNSFAKQQPRQERWPDLIIADPPRSGLGPVVTQHFAGMLRSAITGKGQAPHLILVFCDPAACARDVGQLLLAGYLLKEFVLVDAFAQTRHYECIVHLCRE